MGVFFERGATAKQKAWTLFLYAMLGSMLWGMFSDIIVNEDILIPLAWLAAGISVLGVGYSLYALFKAESRLREVARAQRRKTWLMGLGLVIGIPILCFGFLVKGLPTVLHYALARDGEQIVVVDHLAANYSSRVCNGGVFIQGPHSFLNDEICGIQEKDWRGLKPGAIIRLMGEESVFGFTYDRYQIFPSLPS